MGEGGHNIEDELNARFRQHGNEPALDRKDEVYHGFSYKSHRDKKAAAEYFKLAQQRYLGPEHAEDTKQHELGHALADEGAGKFILQANQTHNRAYYFAVGKRSPQELIRIIESGGGTLSESDKEQIKFLEEQLKKEKKWWQFWR